MRYISIVVESCLVCTAVFYLLEVAFENLGFCDFKGSVFAVATSTALIYQFRNLRKETL